MANGAISEAVRTFTTGFSHPRLFHFLPAASKADQLLYCDTDSVILVVDFGRPLNPRDPGSCVRSPVDHDHVIPFGAALDGCRNWRLRGTQRSRLRDQSRMYYCGEAQERQGSRAKGLRRDVPTSQSTGTIPASCSIWLEGCDGCKKLRYRLTDVVFAENRDHLARAQLHRTVQITSTHEGINHGIWGTQAVG